MGQFTKIYGYIVFIFIVILFFIVKCSTPSQNLKKIETKKSDTLVVDTTLKK
jgi:hypothetical protein